MDALIVKYIVKNSGGMTLQDTQNNNLYNIALYSISTRPVQNAVHFFYSGTNCNVGNWRITLKKLNITQVSWEYLPDDLILDDSRCPPGTDKY